MSKLRERPEGTPPGRGSVSGLRTGSAVSFNGVRVGEITEIKFDPQRPNQVSALISVERKTPVRADTRVDVEVPGLMGSPSIVLKGGASDAPELGSPRGEPPTLLVDRRAGRDTMQTARDVLQNIDKVLAENSAPLHSAIANFDEFSGVLARNSNRLDEIVDGLIRLTGGSTKQQQLAVYDLEAPKFGPDIKVPHGQLVIPEPTAVVALDTQRILLRPREGAIVAVEGAQGAMRSRSSFNPRLFRVSKMRTISRPAVPQMHPPQTFSCCSTFARFRYLHPATERRKLS